ncbi:MAG: helix-turn-helix domain-containing protein, partial [Microbacterium sp.]
LLRDLRPDILITDIRMPNMSGLEMLEAHPPGESYEALVLTGFDEFDLAKQALRLGVIDYLLKPVDPDELRQSIALAGARQESRRRHEHERTAAESLQIAQGFLDEAPLPEGQRSEYVARMLEFAHAEYTHRIQLKDLASRIGVTSGYLNSQFKQEIGTTFNDYLNRYRIQQAVRLLATEGMKVYLVAERVGIPDYKYFVKVFRKYVGHSPHELQRRG